MQEIQIETVRRGREIIVVVTGKNAIVDAQSALELAMRVRYETGAEKIAVDKRAVIDDFFILSTGIAGEALQKFINYHVKAAFFGDYSRYTSKPLKDFIYESNRGHDFFFTATRDEALEKLASAR